MKNLLVNINLPEVESKIKMLNKQLEQGYITKRTYNSRLRVLDSIKSFLLDKEKLIDL